jgi:hypothetical protein
VARILYVQLLCQIRLALYYRLVTVSSWIKSGALRTIIRHNSGLLVSFCGVVSCSDHSMAALGGDWGALREPVALQHAAAQRIERVAPATDADRKACADYGGH